MKEAGRPFPKISDDEVIDFMVLEAVVVRTKIEDNNAREEAEKKDWKKDLSSLEAHR